MQTNKFFQQTLNSIVLTSVNEGVVAQIFQGLSSNISCDIHGISVWLLKQCYKHLLAPLNRMANLSFEHRGQYQICWKQQIIITILNKDDPRLINNYHPISILPAISKVFEKIFLSQSKNCLSQFLILDSEQYEFRKISPQLMQLQTLQEVVDGLKRREYVLSLFYWPV